MSNLGGYQKLTTAAKAVRGPKNLVGLLIASGVVVGAVVGSSTTLGTQKAIKAVKNKINKKNTHNIDSGKVFVFRTEDTDSNGLVFKDGDTYRILDRDEDSILIEKFGDNNNPYFVSAEFLEKVSDFVSYE